VKEGVLVSGVNPETPASRAGLKAGDVIVRVDGSSVDDAGELAQRLGDVDDGAEVKLGIVRDKKEVTLTVKLEDTGRRSRTVWHA
jgi:S1-C subfamily serine protease